MRKLALKVEELAVETFVTAADGGAGRGTVFGEQSGVGTCATCVNYLCWESRLQTNCCTQNPANGCSLPGVC
jgi:hypothetical protein